MANYRMDISYDGKNYHGWAKQKNVKTIQSELEDILSKIGNEKILVFGSGRTDAHVHAYHQVVSFKIKLMKKEILNALHRMLPDDIKINSLKEVDAAFHARFSAQAKEYIYKIYNKNNNPFYHDYYLTYPKPISLSKIKTAAKIFVGRHNFLSFSISDIEDTIRTIEYIKINKKENEIIIRIKGDGFLRGMVRMIVGSLIDINENKKTITDIKNLLKNPKKGSSITKVRASGLYLNKVWY